MHKITPHTRQKEVHMKELHAKAARIFSICFSLIALYLAATALYAVFTMGSLNARQILFEMLHSIAISALLSLGGVLLIDSELKRH